MVTAAVVIGAALVVGAAVWAWVYVPALYPAPPLSGDRSVDAMDRSTRSQAVVTTRASVLAGLAGLGALVTIGINYRNSRTATENLRVANETIRIAERGHLTDRYAKAIEHLGTTTTEGSLAIRLGGIYALQQFAVEADNHQDQTTVVEVLSAFIRANLPVRRPSGDGSAADPIEPTPTGPTDAPPDVLAAISVLARLPSRRVRRTDFTGVDFTGLRLTRARLDVSDLTGAYLRGACLRGADLGGSSLAEADLRDTTLVGANLAGAHLSGADLRGANLETADLTRADLVGADLFGADLRGARLRGATLRRADLSRADLTVADLVDADVTEADFSDALLVSANLKGVSGLTTDQLSADQESVVRHVPRLISDR